MFIKTVVVLAIVSLAYCADIRQQFLDVHNKLRANHNSPPLKLDANLNNLAQAWAEEMAAMEETEHDPDQTLGENIGCTTSDLDPEETVAFFYSEIDDYNFDDPEDPNNEEAGHFTQVIWKNTKLIGVGWAKGNDGATYTSVKYDPAGNMPGEFEENVGRPIKRMVLKKPRSNCDTRKMEKNVL